MRHIILHNHLFKNAGTSVDHILRQNFQGRWISREFPDNDPSNTAKVAAWITGNPEIVAFSSHTIQSPLPRMKGVRIIPIVMLRDPVDRIASAYRFERVQDAETRGAQLARQNGFAGYVHARLSTAGDRQCHNFQTARLAALSADPIADEFDRACAAVAEIVQMGVLGMVADFDTAMTRLSDVVRPHFPSFAWRPVTANATSRNHAHAVSPDMRDILEEMNRDDFKLLRHAHGVISQASTGAPTAHRSGT